MKTRCLLLPSALSLSFLVGCAGEEATGPDATSVPPVSNPSAPTAAEVKSEAEAKPEEKAPEVTPAPEKAEEKAPADEAKKAEGEEKAPADEAKKAEGEEKAPAEEPKKADAKPSLEGPSTEAGAAKLTDEEIAEIKKLPADEQASALAQAVCPVSGHNLGSMELPIKVSAEGRTFYLCCEGCEKKVKNDPKAVIAELDKLIKK